MNTEETAAISYATFTTTITAMAAHFVIYTVRTRTFAGLYKHIYRALPAHLQGEWKVIGMGGAGAVPRTHEILAAQPDMHWDRGKTEGLLRGRNFPVGIVEARDVIRRYKDLAGIHQRKKVRNGRFVGFVYV